GRGWGVGVRGCASLARDTKSWIPAVAGMNGELVTRVVDEKNIVALLDARRREQDLPEHTQADRRQRAEPRRNARRHRSRYNEHGRNDEQRVAEEVVDGQPERRDDEDERGELEPRLRPRRRGAAIIGMCGVQCSAPGFAVGADFACSSCAGLTRASIFLAKKSLRRLMDCRVKPGNDDLK